MTEFPSVTKYMASRLITFRPDTPIHTAIDTILKRKISGAPVVDNDYHLVGMLSEVDCLKILVELSYSRQPQTGSLVSDYMSTQMITLDASKTVVDAAYVFVKQGIKRLPVLDNGKLIGQISRRDVLRAIQNMDPKIKLVPDSWRGRVPVVEDNKKSRYTENA